MPKSLASYFYSRCCTYKWPNLSAVLYFIHNVETHIKVTHCCSLFVCTPLWLS